MITYDDSYDDDQDDDWDQDDTKTWFGWTTWPAPHPYNRQAWALGRWWPVVGIESPYLSIRTTLGFFRWHPAYPERVLLNGPPLHTATNGPWTRGRHDCGRIVEVVDMQWGDGVFMPNVELCGCGAWHARDVAQ